jgi:hypothetical protein
MTTRIFRNLWSSIVSVSFFISTQTTVIPAEAERAGIQRFKTNLDSRLHGNDGKTSRCLSRNESIGRILFMLSLSQHLRVAVDGGFAISETTAEPGQDKDKQQESCRA